MKKEGKIKKHRNNKFKKKKNKQKMRKVIEMKKLKKLKKILKNKNLLQDLLKKTGKKKNPKEQTLEKDKVNTIKNKAKENKT
jgi:hypothetical protein